MKKSELFRQAYCAEKTQSWFCLDEDGNVLWANSAAEEELPLLEVGKPISDGPFTFPKGEENESFLILAGGRMARLNRFFEEDDSAIYLAAPMTGFIPIEEYDIRPNTVMLAARIREKISRIRSFICETSSGLSDIQADYLGTVPHLAGELDRQIGWLNGAGKDCDGLIRYILQFEEDFACNDTRRRGLIDAGQFLPAFFRDVEISLQEMDVPLELQCSWEALDTVCTIACSRERFAMALLGLVRAAAVKAMQKDGVRFSILGRITGEELLLRIRDNSTDPAELEAYEPLEIWGGYRIPTPAHQGVNNLRRFLDTVGGSMMVIRTPGEAGYMMQLRFPASPGKSAVLECCTAYRLEGLDTGGRWPADFSGQKDLIRIMLSTLEDDMR